MVGETIPQITTDILTQTSSGKITLDLALFFSAVCPGQEIKPTISYPF
jgi:hypothetical protein